MADFYVLVCEYYAYSVVIYDYLLLEIDISLLMFCKYGCFS